MPTMGEKRKIKVRRVKKIMAILRQVEAPPRGWTKGKSAWIKHVSAMHHVARQSIYRWRASYRKRGAAGLEHQKSNAGKPKGWSVEALNFWFGICLIPRKRELSLKVLYEYLIHEAQLRGWQVGRWPSARWWLVKKAKALIENERDVSGLSATTKIGREANEKKE